MKPIVVICWLLSLVAITCHATVYRWTDENGNVVYSDTPKPGATSVDLRSRVQNVADASATNATAAEAQQNDVEAKTPRAALAIIDPANDATIRSSQGNLVVSAELAIPPGITQRLQLLVDGQPQGEPQGASTFVLTGVERGSHTLQLQLVNELGSQLAVSKSITIHMHRPSKLHSNKRGPVATPTN